MASAGIILRNKNLVGGRDITPVKMPDEHKTAFQEGCYILFLRWTALQLGIQNQWGGPDSAQRAETLLNNVINWFYTEKDPDQCDLEDLLDDSLQNEFNILADDDSPYQVSRSMFNLYNQVARGDYSYLQTLRQSQPAPAAACQQEKRPDDPEQDSSSDEDDDGSDDDAMDADGDEEMHDAGMEEDKSTKNQPVIDDDGFQVVQRKGRGGRR